MDSTIIKSSKDVKDTKAWWSNKKQELVNSIRTTIEEGGMDKEVLEIMLEMVENARVKNSIKNYYDEIEDKEV